MSVIAVTSARSGGITTTTVALGLSWPTRSLVAECDPAGGTVWATTHRGRSRSRGGLRAVALAARRPDFTPTEFWAATQPLLDGRGHVLTGITDPAQLPVVAAKWGWLSEAFQALGYQQPPTDVIVDCGRLGTEGFPTPIVAAADCVLLLIQPTLADVSHAQGRVPALRAMLADGQLLKAALVCAGPYSAAQVAEAVDLDVIADLPPDGKAAAMLNGDALAGPRLDRSPLMRAAAGLAADLFAMTSKGRIPARPPYPPPDERPGLVPGLGAKREGVVA